MTTKMNYGMINNTIIFFSLEVVSFSCSAIGWICKERWDGMKRKGIEPNEVRKYFLITGAFLIFMIGSLSFFLSWLQKDVEINSQKNVAINVERQSYHLDSIIDIQFSYLFGIAAYMGERKEMFSRKNKRLIQSIVKEQDLDLIALMDADGNTFYSNGARKSVKTRKYFK